MRERRRQGFTLLELMIAVGVFLVVMAGVFQTFSVQHKTSAVVEEVAEMQQNLRAVSDLLEHDVRRAGYMVPRTAAVCGWDRVDAADTLFVSNADVLRPVDGLESVDPDLVKGEMGVKLDVGPGWVASGSAFDLQSPQLPRVWVDVQADGDDFDLGGGVILVDRNNPQGTVACGQITQYDIATPRMRINWGPTSFSATSLSGDVVLVPAHVYSIVTPATGPSRLERDGLILAKGVEDFQVVYFFDTDEDHVEDPGEVFADSGTAAYPPPAGTDMTQLLELELNLVTVARDDDPDQDFTPMAGQATGNRTAASLAGPDRKRRRVNTARVRLRNVG
jgi:prepilin-type N-terminal cleavage/methylation domain-containing protein